MIQKLFTTGVLFFSFHSTLFAAQPTSFSKKVLERTAKIKVELNPSTVRCLVGDYGGSSLKISLPGLRSHSAFRHTTNGETEPCINAGYCRSGLFPNGLTPEAILRGQNSSEEIDVKIETFEEFQFNHESKKCSRYIREKVSTQVRGMDFSHEDGTTIGDANYETCLTQISSP